MNTELFIARRIVSRSENDNNISGPIVSIAIKGIALGLAVMIVAVAIITGFKTEIRNKVIGFGSHIQIINHDSNISYETVPINKQQSFIPQLNNTEGIKHVQVFATKAGIIKTEDEIQGVVLKGVGSDFDWSFFDDKIVKGKSISISDSTKSTKVLISQNQASLLKLDVGDDLRMYFIQEPPRMRKFSIEGIYETGMETFDKLFVFADIKHIQKLNNWSTDQVSGFEIFIDDFDDLDKMKKEVFGYAGYQFTEDGGKLKVLTVKEKYVQEFDWLELQDLNVWVILILMTIVAGINMISGILILILERTSMIGVLKALGAENWSVRKIFLYNASFLIGRGLLWGNVIGIALCLLQSYFGIIQLDPASYYVDTVPININLLHILFLNIGTLIATVTMLILPSFIITKISPAQAIRFN